MKHPEARMGNDIARQFEHVPPEVAVDAIARHIETFWHPRMRDRLRHVVDTDSEALDPLVVAAAKVLRDKVARRETDAQP